MQTIWDLLPASLWPTQRFIPPDEAARTMRLWQALQASGNSSSPYNRADPPWTRPLIPAAPASGGEDHSATSAETDAQGGILGAIFGEAANAAPATNPGPLPPPTSQRRPLGLVGNAQLAAPAALMALPDQVSWDELRRSLARRIGSPDVQLAPDVRLDVQRLPLDPDPRAIWKLSDWPLPALTAAGEPVLTSLGRPMTLGQQLLLGQRWHGTLNMRDEATMRRFDEYMRRR
jgi:hypothetical protein